MRLGPRAIVATAALVVAATLAGCADDPEPTPVACIAGSDTYLGALADAPEPVRLRGGTPISDCLVPDQEPSDQQRVGAAVIEAATRLNAGARRDPTGPEAVRLGYLVGSLQRAARETGDQHADLVRRLDAAARFSSGGLLPAAFERTFGEGYAAGQRTG